MQSRGPSPHDYRTDCVGVAKGASIDRLTPMGRCSERVFRHRGRLRRYKMGCLSRASSFFVWEGDGGECYHDFPSFFCLGVLSLYSFVAKSGKIKELGKECWLIET